ncbi:MAG: glutamate racemase [Eggerthellaceae bacterium]
MDTNETTIEPLEGACAALHNAPIGVFDSGFGGLTVAREIAKLPRVHRLPGRFGTLLRPRSWTVDGFVQQIGAWLVERGVSSRATRPRQAWRMRSGRFLLPVIGVVSGPALRPCHEEPPRGRDRHEGHGESAPTPRQSPPRRRHYRVLHGHAAFRGDSRAGPAHGRGPHQDFTSLIVTVYIRPAFRRSPASTSSRCAAATSTRSCWGALPAAQALIGGVVGHDVTLISSAQEAAHDVAHILSRRGALASEDHEPSYDFYTTGEDVGEFRSFGARVFRTDIDRVGRVAFPS